jgi:hypothetical protein
MLAPSFSATTLEELIMRYITLLKKEQKLLGDEALPLEDFLDLVKRVLHQCKNPEQCLSKLKTFYGDSTEPTYKANEIKDIQLVSQIYSVDTTTLQHEIDKMTKPIIGDWYADLNQIKDLLMKNEYTVTPDSFDSYELYFQWRTKEINEIDSLVKGRPARGGVIPQYPKSSFEELLQKVFTNYGLTQCLHLIDKCCKYWRIEKNTRAVLIHKVANNTILNTEIYDAQASEQIFGMCSEVDLIWAKDDKAQWDLNWQESTTKLMNSLRSKIQDIYTYPKFTPLLQIYYTYIEATPRKWFKRFRNTLLSTTEAKYVEFLQLVPRDSSLSLQHIQEVSHRIYETIKSLQKKYPKPLLDELSIPKECGLMFIQFFSQDATNMLKHIAHYSLNEQADCAEALDTYLELKHLKGIHVQLINDPFPMKLEKLFFQYLDEFADNTGEKFIPIIEGAISSDDFKPLDHDNGRLYSSSVLDIYKMVNETWSLVKGYHWGNDIQLAYVYTKLLKGVSESIGIYCSKLVSKVDEDLRDVAEVSTDKRKSLWSFKNDSQVPTSYNFKLETCVMLNDLSELLNQLIELEHNVNPENVQRILHDTLENIEQKGGSNMFTVRIIEAQNIKPSDGLADTYISVMNTSTRKEIGKTKLVSKTLNPRYDQVFEVETREPVTLSFSLWDKSSHYDNLIGRTILSLDPSKFNANGEPVLITKDLDVQGSLNMEVFLESEQNDAIFYIGKAHRTIVRSMDMVISKIVDKLSVFITHCLSRQTLKLCSTTEVDSVNDSIAPLFEYLNANLQTLAMNLTPELLIKVMIQAWSVVLDTIDNLVLPPLSSANALLANSKWSLNMLNRTLPGYGKMLSLQEIKFVRIWLVSLCEFFHNEGEGPPLLVLQNLHYHKLSEIVEYYDISAEKLRRLIDEWTPRCINAIKERNFMVDDSLRRSETIVAHGTKKNRERSQSHAKQQVSQLDLEDVVLRVLLCKDERDFVHKRLKERERVMKSVATERLAKLSMRAR